MNDRWRTVCGLLLAACVAAGSSVGCVVDDDSEDVETTAEALTTGCNSGVGPGVYDQWITSNGVPREYIVQVPSGYSQTAGSRLVLYFHGFGGHWDPTTNPPQNSQLATVAEQNNFVVVWVNGLAGQGATCWGSGGTWCTGRDDVKFARDVVADVNAHLCIDQRKVFATGFSNGGMMSHRLACEASDLFAGIVSIAGAPMLTPAQCKPTYPVSVVEIHGDKDFGVCWNGNAACGDPNYYNSVDGTQSFWKSRNRTNGTPVQDFSNGGATCTRYPGGLSNTDVQLCKIVGGTHCTPGDGGCDTFTTLNAHTRIASFVTSHSKPRRR